MTPPTRTARVFVGTLDVAEKVRVLLRSEGIDASLVHLPFQSPQCVEGAYSPTFRQAEVHVPLHAQASAHAVVESNRQLVKDWSGFPLDGTPIEVDAPAKGPPKAGR